MRIYEQSNLDDLEGSTLVRVTQSNITTKESKDFNIWQTKESEEEEEEVIDYGNTFLALDSAQQLTTVPNCGTAA